MMITILTWVSIITGGLLVVIMLLSLIGGIDFDMDIDVEVGSTDTDVDSGGLGILKGVLTFVSVGSWVMKILLVGNKHPGIAIGVGIFAGVLAFMLLNYLLKLLLRNQENVNWSVNDALFQKGEVYLRIPEGSESGIVQINVKGAMREMKAKSKDGEEIPTGSPIMVVDLEDEYALVQKLN